MTQSLSYDDKQMLDNQLAGSQDGCQNSIKVVFVIETKGYNVRHLEISDSNPNPPYGFTATTKLHVIGNTNIRLGWNSTDRSSLILLCSSFNNFYQSLRNHSFAFTTPSSASALFLLRCQPPILVSTIPTHTFNHSGSKSGRDRPVVPAAGSPAISRKNSKNSS
jgi:hypothetical protein